MKIAIVFGTRPEVIKLAPIIYALKNHFKLTTVFSGQHTSLINNALSFFDITPDYTFSCMNKKPDLGTLTARINREMSAVFKKEKPKAVIVQGDTMTTYTAAFQGFLSKMPVVHVEAGLRTNNKFSPYPEEVLRTLVSRIADFHFAPTAGARENLLSEKIRRDRILITGNTVVDALLLAERMLDEKEIFSELSKALSMDAGEGFRKKKTVLVTSHRRENISFGLKQICSAVNTLSDRYKNLLFIWPLHKNPDVRKIVFREINKRRENILITEALSYPATVYLMRKSVIIMTDSGGIQEEAPTFRRPVLVLRESTERPEIIESGTGFLTGTDDKKICRVFSKLYEDRDFYKRATRVKNPFGDGKASERILKFFLNRDVQDFISRYPASFDMEFRGFK
ncbi:MAG: UDP-N-acetylglucosamine 2-epimerase (non-hydrolyzing) [Candidatus Omnitrophica bacterium]|nr:UDP-N-acetylglucosamine 2-epimerase (non-hydrolyzing) [Candidatus Omnitrophota bacterium]